MFMWQSDMIGMVQFIDECLNRILNTFEQPLRWLAKMK